eukprot:TRINITY_DN1228_c0_g1_i2.p1 TRINITY_DN1228_c0_g1~~TRINITY_DN1228_c0_g1_i2.p1  ORF type:complete len:712 (-),score=222.82 TRINITY_DN1228_c0_g1_i2:67-2202(-)
MQVSTTNDVKIYNLSAGKSLPDWISERKRRKLVKQDIDIRRRIELIQDFDMPAISEVIRVSKDGQYVLATGTYKPRVRCYDLNNLGLKFERCMDAEVVTFDILSDDYSKVVFLQCDRYVEFHTQQGRYYRFRIPKYGRDMTYHASTCDLYFVGSSHQIYRFNLEQGRFLNPLESEASALNCIKINPEHNLICVGTVAGKVEAWDPRSRSRAAVLDCGLQAIVPETEQVTSVPAVTSIAFRDGLNMGVGTSTGLVLLYDIRSNKPMRTKDHMYGLPIRKVEYHKEYNNDLILSMDSQTVKIWERETGKPYTSIEATADFTDMCLYKQSGLIFLANEQPKMQTFYVPSLGPAPKWASFLDSLTEELEESRTATVYDDYKFVTKQELYELGLDHLIGSALLRAHMHGFYMDVRLYRKALSAKAPSRTETLKKDFIRSEIDKMREKRVQVSSNLPSVNKDLFLKLKAEKEDSASKKRQKKKAKESLLEDNRFNSLFTDANFEVDTNEETYRLLNPVVSKLDKTKLKEMEDKLEGRSRRGRGEDDQESDIEAKNSEDDDLASSSDEDDDGSDDEEESSDDEHQWTQEVKRAHKNIQAERAEAQRAARQQKVQQKLSKISQAQHKFAELEDTSGGKQARKKSKQSLEARLDSEEVAEVKATETGHTFTFTMDKPKQVKRREEEAARHLAERKEIRRSAKHLKKDKIPPKFWMGKRVR